MQSRMAALEKKMPPVSTTSESSQNVAGGTFGKHKGSMSKKYIAAISKKGKLESVANESKAGDKSLNQSKSQAHFERLLPSTT